jgi:RNA polymerase sigma-70 factor (ECF subfamily)
MTSNPDTAIDWSWQLEQNRSWLTKVLRARIGNSHDVEDVFQELALSVLKQVEKLRQPIKNEPENETPNETPIESQSQGQSQHALAVPVDPDKVAPWLYRLAVRHCVNFYRKSNRLTHAKPSADLEPQAETFEPLDWIMRNERRHLFQDAFKQLPAEDREILSLKYSENWTYQQLAQKLGATVRNIEYRLLTARKRLRKLLSS